MQYKKNSQNTENLFIKPDNRLKKILKIVLPKIVINLILKFKLIYLDKYIDFVLYKILKTIYLSFSDPIYKKLPVKHSSCFFSLNQFLKKTKNQEYDFFLTAGSLLGSIRQESFAGRPTDIDLGMLSIKADKFLKNLENINKKGISRIDKFYDDENFLSRFQILVFGEIIDISIFRPCIIDNKNLWKGEYNENNHKNKKYTFIDYESLINLEKTKLYGSEYLCPSNPEMYLEEKFGRDWKIPDKKQFMWKKKF